jgi:hypothetical protein
LFSALLGPFGSTLGAPNSTGGSPPVITSPSSLVAGTVNTLYPTTTFTATGTAPITWSLAPGSTLPAGMSFSSGGVLSGTPTATTSGSVTFRAINAFGFEDRVLTLTVNAVGGPVLVSSPTISAWRGTTSTVGSILQVTMGTYDYQSWSQNVTVSSVSSQLPDQGGYSYVYDVTLSTTPERAWKSGFVFFQSSTVNPYFILSITGNVLRVSAQGTLAGNWSYSVPAQRTVLPPLAGTSSIITTAPVQRAYQWLRDGSPITNQTAPVYTTTASDLNKTISVQETAYFWDDLVNVTTATSSGVSVSSGSISNKLVIDSDFTFNGSFGFNAFGGAEALPGIATSISSYNGNATIYIGWHQGSPYTINAFAEYTIPATLGTYTSGYTGLPLANAARGSAPVEPTEGGLAALGITGGSGSQIYGTMPVSDGYLLLTAANPYSANQTGGFWRRPQDLSNTGNVSTSFFVVDPLQSVLGTRSTAGYMCKVPTTTVDGINYRTALGGDILSGNCKLSIENTVARRPAAIAWNSADISGALSIAYSGNVVTASAGSGGVSSITFDTNVSGDLTNQRVLITSGPAYKRLAQISSYNTTTRVASLTSLNPGVEAYANISITNAFKENPARIVISNPGYFDSGESSGGGIRITGVGGMTQLNNNVYYMRMDGSNAYLYTNKELTTAVDATAFGTYTSGGQIQYVPDTSSQYVIVRKIDGYQLCGSNTDLKATVRNFTVDGIWQEGGGPIGMCVPPGTRSLLFFGTGYDGPQSYTPVNSINADALVGPIGYDPNGQGTGPHGRPYSVRVYAYDLDDLAAAKISGAFQSVLPYAIFRLNIPNVVGANPKTIVGTAYDFATKKLYVTTFGGPNSRGVCHVFTITRAVVE